jgi:sorbitol-specific phosphotransferase system component IIBC
MAGENRFTADVLDASGATDHAATYEGFIKYSVALAIACFVVLTALCIFAFAPSGALSLFMGFGGLIVGLLAVIIDIRIGSGKWLLSGAVAAVFALLAAMLLV